MAHTDGLLAAVRFISPNGLAVDGAGNLYLSDSTTLRRINVTTGIVDLLAGLPHSPGSVDGPAVGAGAALFFSPAGVAVKADGSAVYVADHGAHVIRRIAGGNVLTIAGGHFLSGSVDGLGTVARFANPIGIALSADENTLYVADSSNNTIRSIALNIAGFPVTTRAGTPGLFGTEDGAGPAARFWVPTAVALDPTGTALAIVDGGNKLVRVMLLSNFQVNTLAGTPLTGGSQDASAADLAFGVRAKFDFATVTAGTNGAAYQSDGNLMIADSANNTLRRISSVAHVTTPVGKATEWGHANGSGIDARFVNPAGLALEPAGPGRLIVADTSNHSVRVIGIRTDATVTVSRFSAKNRRGRWGRGVTLLRGVTSCATIALSLRRSVSRQSNGEAGFKPGSFRFLAWPQPPRVDPWWQVPSFTGRGLTPFRRVSFLFTAVARRRDPTSTNRHETIPKTPLHCSQIHFRNGWWH